MHKDTSNIAIIPARGGSKRLPRKNLYPIHGKPMIGWVIEKAISSGLFRQVIVSSEDHEVLEAARSFGAEPYQRPEHLADDMTHVGPVVDDVVESLKLRADTVCLLFATALLMRTHHLKQAFALLCKPEVKTVVPITEFDSAIQRAYEMHQDGSIQMATPEFFQSRSQDLPKRFRDAGMFSWSKTLGHGGKVLGYVVPRTEAVDIDTPDDLSLAEALFNLQRRDS